MEACLRIPRVDFNLNNEFALTVAWKNQRRIELKNVLSGRLDTAHTAMPVDDCFQKLKGNVKDSSLNKCWNAVNANLTERKLKDAKPTATPWTAGWWTFQGRLTLLIKLQCRMHQPDSWGNLESINFPKNILPRYRKPCVSEWPRFHLTALSSSQEGLKQEGKRYHGNS